MQLAASGDFESIGRIGLFNAHADVRLDLLEQAVSDISRSNELALAARERAVVDHEVHGYCGLVYFYERHRLDAVRGAGGLADIYIADAGDADNIARGGGIDLDTRESLKLIEARHPDILLSAVRFTEHYRLVLLDPAALNSADAYSADIIIVVKAREEYLKRGIDVAVGSFDMLEN